MSTNDKLREALERAQQDINWILNSRQFLNGLVFDYIDEALAASKPEPQAQAGEREFESVKDVQIRRLESALASKEDEYQRLHAHCLAYKEAIAKKDAALKACVEALDSKYIVGSGAWMAQRDAAITQAQEALK